MLQDDIEQEPLEYTPELKKKLDEAYAYYKNGGKMISAVEADKQIKKILQSPKRRWITNSYFYPLLCLNMKMQCGGIRLEAPVQQKDL